MQKGPETKQELLLEHIGGAMYGEVNHGYEFTEQHLIEFLNIARESNLPGGVDLSGICSFLNTKTHNLHKIPVDALIRERSWSLERFRAMAEDINKHAYLKKEPLLILSKHKPIKELKKQHDNLEPIELVPYTEADELLEVFNDKASALSLFEKMEALSQIEDANTPPMPLPNALAIQGGGAKGAGYPRAKKALDNLGIEPKIISGASAGAITTAMLSFGLSGEQFTQMSQDMDFRDFCDYHPSTFGSKIGGTIAGQAGAVLWQNHVFSGEAFYDWIRGQVALNFGDPDITLAQVQEHFPETPQMILMGTRVDDDAKHKQIAFGAHDHRYCDVKLADAVRASMSFPFAWDQFKVHEVKEGKEKTLGTFTDGGVLNNLPIDVLHLLVESPYTMPTRQLGEHVVHINPRAMGWSLTSKLKNVRSDVTALTPRLEMLREDKGLVENQQKDDDIEIGKRKLKAYTKSKLKETYTRWNLAQPLKQNLFGEGGGTSQLDKKKLDTYKGQIAQMYTEGVDTLQFDVPDWQLEAIGASCENAVYNNLLARMDPTQRYEDYFKGVSTTRKNAYNSKLFEPEATLSASIQQDLIEKLNNQFKQDVKEKDLNRVQDLTKLLIDVYTELNVVAKVQKLEGKLGPEQNELIQKYKDLSKNRRLKFLSFHIAELKNKQIFKENPKVLELCINTARKQIQANKEAKLAREQQLQLNMDVNHIAQKINSLLDDAKHEMNTDEKKRKVYLAETILKGQCSNILKVLEIQPGLLYKFIEAGDLDTFKRILEKIRVTCHQLDQQGRSWPVSLGLLKKAEAETWENFMDRFELLMQHFCKPSLYEAAISKGELKHLQILLTRTTPSITGLAGKPLYRFGSPLHMDEIYQKNALHHAIDANNAEAFALICYDLNEDEQKQLLQRNSNGESIAHYLIKHASPEFLQNLLGHGQIYANEPIVKMLFGETSRDEYEYCSGADRFGYGQTYAELCLARSQKDEDTTSSLTKLCKMLKVGMSKHDNSKYEEVIAPTAKELTEINPMNDQKLGQVIKLTGNKNSDAHLCMELLTATNEHGLNLLMQAASLNNPKLSTCVMEMLDIVHEAKDPNLNTLLLTLVNSKFDRKSPLLLACEHGNLELTKKLVLEGANINRAGPAMGCASALTAAASKGHLNIVDCLIELKESSIVVNNNKVTVKASRFLQDQFGNTPLHYLAANPKANFKDFMGILEKTSRPGAEAYLRLTRVQNANGLTPFDLLVDNCRLDIIKELNKYNVKQSSSIAKHSRGGWYLDHYLDMTQKRPDGRTSVEVLFELANTPGEQQEAYKEMCMLVLENLSQEAIFRMDSKGRNILHYVVSSDFLSDICLEKYLNRGLTKGMKSTTQYHERTNTPDYKGESPLITLLKSNNTKVLETFIKNNTGYFLGSGTWGLIHYFDLTSRRIDGMTDLEKAIHLKRTGEGKYDDIVNMLCKNVPSNLLVDAQEAVKSRLEGQGKKYEKPRL